MAGILLADDAPIVRSTIARIITSNRGELRPILEASSGEEAVELARRVRPDIVIMDIKMPGLDGLQATAIIREELPDTKVIILTAYDEFPYVQRALKLGAVDYLLKPVRPAKLLEVVDEVYRQLVAQRHQVQEAAEAKTFVQRTLPMLEASLVDQLVHGRSPGRAAIASSLKQLGKTLSWPAVLVAAVEDFETVSEGGAYSSLTELAPSVIGRIETFLVGYSPPGRVVAIVSTDHHLAAISQLRQLGSIIQQALEIQLNRSVVVGIGHRYADIEAIPISYAEASLACRYYAAGLHQYVFHIEDIDEINDRKRLAYPVQLEHQILRLVSQGEIEPCAELMIQMLDHLTYQFRTKPEIIRSRLIELNALIARSIIESGAASLDVLDLSHQQVSALYSLTTVSDMRAWALHSFAELAAAIPSVYTPGGVGGEAVQRAVEYIHRHRSRPDLALGQVAEAVSLSPSHLAHLLKEHVGLSYRNYLIALRMEEAKKLLRTTDMTIAAVAEAVGYENVTNFYRLFQREVGCTPAAYRKTG
jgi:two-component system response regulator YesN